MNSDIYKLVVSKGLLKIAQQADPVTLGKSFLAGFDPTGTATFDLSQRATRHKSHLTSGFIGGVVGGGTILPSAVTGTLGAVSGFSKAKGGFGARLAGAAAGFASGAVSPYKQLYHGTKALRALKSGKITESAAGSLHSAFGLKGSGAIIKSLPSRLAIGAARHTAPGKGMIKLLGQQTGGAYAGIGAGAVLGGGSSVLQYGQGKKVGDNRRQLLNNNAAS